MFKRYFSWLIVLPVTLFFSQCAIEDDIPYPYVESAITAFEVEGQCNETGTGDGSSVINYDEHTIKVYVGNDVDLNRLSISRLEVSNDGTISVAKGACVHPDQFPTEGFKEAKNPEATRVNFSKPVQFTLTKYEREFVWTVSVTQVVRSDVDVFVRCSSATITGKAFGGVAPFKVEYREKDSQDVRNVPADKIKVVGEVYTAELEGLAPGTTYEYTAYAGNGKIENAVFETAPEVQLPNSSFDYWCSEGTGTRTLWQPWAVGEKPFWDTGNRGATTVGASNSTGVTEDGRTFANLQSKYIVVKFAAGNIFCGDYLATDGTNGVLNFGRPFESFPTKMKFDYKFKTSTINKGGTSWNDSYRNYISKELYDGLVGKPDSCLIYVALLDDYVDEADRAANTYEGIPYPWLIRTKPSELHLFDPKSPRVIAYGQLTQGKDVNEWTTEEITLNYRYTDRKPKYIMVVASSSKYGDYFTGGDKTLLQLDNLELIYK